MEILELKITISENFPSCLSTLKITKLNQDILVKGYKL